MTKNYSTIYEHTRNMIGSYAKENPEMMTAFSKVHQIGSKDGALKSKFKELIALGISINTQCEGCITMHIHDAVEKGATHDEIIETIGTAIYMGGGPSVVYGSKAFAVLQEFEAITINPLINSINN
ncbi:MAG: carboxymuconolactone decarboxylase family protein [Prolixibacteraceae bacterium]|nr:carboxymuconolactone decarboxylase family protein [Prolixibacteraceae bacterium]